MIRLKDIAAQAGVSLMTVSKAMRNASDVSAQTKARVQLLAQQMGYVPNSLAQGLRNRKTRLLGLVLSTVVNPVFIRTISAIEESAHPLTVWRPPPPSMTFCGNGKPPPSSSASAFPFAPASTMSKATISTAVPR